MLLKNGSKLVYWDQKGARCLKCEENKYSKWYRRVHNDIKPPRLGPEKWMKIVQDVTKGLKSCR